MINEKTAALPLSDTKLREQRIVKGILVVIIVVALAWISLVVFAPGNRSPAEITSAKSHSLIWIDVNKHVYHVAADPWYGRSIDGIGLFAPEWLAKATFCRVALPPPGGFRDPRSLFH